MYILGMQKLNEWNNNKKKKFKQILIIKFFITNCLRFKLLLV